MSKKKKKLKVINDGFENLLTGMGTSKDPLTHTNFVRGNSLTLNYSLISAIYAQNWLASAVVDVPVNDMTRSFIELNMEDEEKEEVIHDALKRLKVKSKFNQALKWAGAYGGSVIIMMVNDGKDLSVPLSVETVRSNGLQNLIVLDRWHITAGPINTDLLNKNFGLPDYYQVNRNGQQIHHTRVLRFDGEVKSIEDFERQGYWGNSVFEKGYQAISNSQTVSLEIAAMTKESNIDVYKIKGLNEMVAMGPEGEAAVTKRLTVAHQLKSYINGIALDADDDYEKKSNTFSGLAELDDRFLLKVAGAAQIPLSKLLGKTDAGLNGNGEGDLKNYYDNISGRQEVELTDSLQLILNIIHVAEFGEFDNVDFSFCPLYQMSQEQEANIKLTNANRDAVYADRGIVSNETIQKQLMSDKVYGAISDDINDTLEVFPDSNENDDGDFMRDIEV
jgi:hypothetical protein